MTNKFPTDKKYAFESRGLSTVKQYSQEFSLAYYHRMGSMVESRMQKAIEMVGSLWYTAWVDAGQPNLELLDKKVDQEAIAKKIAAEEEAIKGEEIKGRAHDD